MNVIGFGRNGCFKHFLGAIVIRLNDCLKSYYFYLLRLKLVLSVML